MPHGHQSDGSGREIVASSSGSDKILGYLNFSDGRQDVRWQQMVCDSFASHSDADRPWLTVPHQWISDLKILQEAGAAGFRDSTQATIVLRTFIDVLPAYQSFHSELLGHCSDRDLFAPLFLVRVLESVLRQVHKHESLVSKPVPPHRSPAPHRRSPASATRSSTNSARYSGPATTRHPPVLP